ncbi:unnamed protein product [Larinioides sclopetarius]|uniref:Uncharacterized protein n=1 Tax=Larinioides sclopetarius TaxID=280406 RepID=A0AAV2AE75_9ARAC
MEQYSLFSRPVGLFKGLMARSCIDTEHSILQTPQLGEEAWRHFGLPRRQPSGNQRFPCWIKRLIVL